MESDRPIQTSRWVGYFPLAALPLTVLVFAERLPAWAFMWSLAVSIFLGLKWLSWWKARASTPHDTWRSAAYLLAWPGMDAESFLDANRIVSLPRIQDWVWATVETGLGAVFFWVVPRNVPHAPPLLQGWIGMLGLVLLLHFGSFRLVALFWQRLGVDAVPIMTSPLRARSLGEFWGRRWNLGFSRLSHDFFVSPFSRRLGPRLAGFLVFAISGLIHDLVISVPARGGYGLPTAYFLIQGAGVSLERSSIGRKMGLRNGVCGRLFMATVVLCPAFWLFHPPFVLRVIIPFMKAMRAL